MSIFAPQNVMGPAHRGNVIQQLAQGAAQNVMRRQQLKSMLQKTVGQMGGPVGGFGAGVPFRGSTMGHATGVRGATMRPVAPGAAGGMAAMGAAGASGPTNSPQFADPGAADLPSLVTPADPGQSGSSTVPAPQTNPATQTPTGGYQWTPAGSGTTQAPSTTPQGTPSALNPAYISDGSGGWTYAGPGPGSATPYSPASAGGSSQLIPLGGGHYYDPSVDAIRGPGGVVQGG